MAIVYALVARGTVVLAEFAAVSGNAGAVARRILEKLPPDAESRLCFAQDRYIFHVLRSDAAGITFLCMANDTFGSNYPSFLPLNSFVRSQFTYIRTWNFSPIYASVLLSCY
jgi:vesicle-associated membrane protein 7